MVVNFSKTSLNWKCCNVVDSIMKEVYCKNISGQILFPNDPHRNLLYHDLTIYKRDLLSGKLQGEEINNRLMVVLEKHLDLLAPLIGPTSSFSQDDLHDTLEASIHELRQPGYHHRLETELKSGFMKCGYSEAAATREAATYTRSPFRISRPVSRNDSGLSAPARLQFGFRHPRRREHRAAASPTSSGSSSSDEGPPSGSGEDPDPPDKNQRANAPAPSQTPNLTKDHLRHLVTTIECFPLSQTIIFGGPTSVPVTALRAESNYHE